MLVKAKPGTLCPKEKKPRDYIGATAEEVPETSYYLRLINDGSLLPVSVDENNGGDHVK